MESKDRLREELMVMFIFYNEVLQKATNKIEFFK